MEEIWLTWGIDILYNTKDMNLKYNNPDFIKIKALIASKDIVKNKRPIYTL